MDNVVNYKAMKKLLLYTCVLANTLVSCQSDDADFIYSSSKDNIYFGIGTAVGLTIAEAEDQELFPEGIQDPRKTLYSFAENQKPTDTVYVPVTISGLRKPVARKFRIVVNADSTTAEAGVHYKPFEEFYTIPADSGGAMLPVILLNKDPRMETQTFRLKLVLVSSDDFDVAVPDNSYANILFSNRLERPDWWTLWENELGTYTRTKHALYLIALGDIENKNLIPNYNGDNGLLIPYNLYLIGKFKALLFDPFLWLQDHPGYVIDEVEPGVYSFYSTANEFRKYRLVYNDQDGEYYFIDENNKFVSADY